MPQGLMPHAPRPWSLELTYLDLFPAPMEGAAAWVACLIAGVSGVVLSAGFLLAEPRSPVARSLAACGIAAGCTIATTVPLILLFEETGRLHWLLRVPIFDALLMWAGGFWLLKISRMANPTGGARAFTLLCVWSIWLATLLVLALAISFPVQRVTEFIVCLGRPQGCGQPGFWMFAIPWTAFFAGMFGGAVVLFSLRIDPAERVRGAALAMAVPFFAGIPNLPAGYNACCGMLGILILATGLIRYHSMLGERAQFLSRFLSPEVDKLVRYRGLDQVMRPKSLEITVVSCDLRGFTRLSQLLASDQVVRLLNEYYDTVGAAVAEFGGTIKDYAGDGVLILVGAPLPREDHARQGLLLAHRLREVARTVVSHWAGPEMQLGMGVGVASGTVTVGAIGSARMEYTAVGPAVNMAARLCAQAKDGEILVDARAAQLAGSSGLQSRGALAFKGMPEAEHFALSV
ncbi:MAG: adenylate/guanylate cyclase domain-containing protein [Panacagrimonas sp.]